MKFIEPIIIAFSMYSKIPMPIINWNKDNMKYIMCYFPLIGIAICLLQFLLFYISKIFSFGNILTATIATIIPLLITGGIHLDGFCDTIDGLSSHQSIDKKLEILSDPNSGAFAIIGCIIYIIVNFSIWTEIVPTIKSISIIGLFYSMSRSFSGLSIVTFPLAKNTGLAAIFSNNAQKNNVKMTMIIYIVFLTIITSLIEVRYSILALCFTLAIFIYYKHISKKEFGGITGDLAGFFLQNAELSILVAIMVGQKIFGIL